MAQHDMNIANQGFPATRADLNNALQALATNSSGTSAPSTTFANQWWYDTTNNKLYIRNEANNAWIQVAVLDQTNNEWQITTGQITAGDSDGLVFKTDDGNTRITLSDGGDVTFADGTDVITASAGTDNIRIGEGAGDSIASGGDENVVIGKDAGTAISTGDGNIAIGHSALSTVSTASFNVAIGHDALKVSTASGNTAIGNNCLDANTSGNALTAVGKDTLSSNTTGANNTALGNDALFANTEGGQNVALGTKALEADTKGSHSTAVGRNALKTQNFTSATDTHNSAFGNNAGQSITTANSCTIVGSNSLSSNQTGNSNTAVGESALTSTTGEKNTAIGAGAGNAITTGTKNTIVGMYNGNEDNLDLRTSTGHVAISNGNGNVRIYCNAEGYSKFKPVNSGHYASGGAYHEFDANNNDTSLIIYYQQHASFVSSVEFTQAQRVASSAYNMAEWRSGAGSDVEFYLRGDGNAYADGSWNGGGADYAEYFEWSDGNSSNQDRTGYTVVLDNEKIRLATSDDAAANIIGAVSVNPSVIGDSDINQWKHKYRRDDLGGFVWETYTVTEWTETVVDQEAADEVLDDDGNVVTPAKEEITREVFHNYETDKIPDGITAPDNATVSTEDADGNTFMRKVLNTDYNPDAAYVSREDRQEWATIGMMGKLRIRKGQPTGDRWIKMRDVSDTVEEWLVR